MFTSQTEKGNFAVGFERDLLKPRSCLKSNYYSMRRLLRETVADPCRGQMEINYLNVPLECYRIEYFSISSDSDDEEMLMRKPSGSSSGGISAFGRFSKNWFSGRRFASLSTIFACFSVI